MDSISRIPGNEIDNICLNDYFYINVVLRGGIMSAIQISAFISTETRDRLESYVKQHGRKKAAVIEEALLHHLSALREIPEDVVIPARLLLSKSSMEKVSEQLVNQTEPSEPLKALFDGS
jgi:hypothetical protein